MTVSIPKKLRVALLRSAILGAGVWVGSALAQPADKLGAGDMQLALQARNALWSEEPFDKLNLGVSVRGGQAVLSGPVPSTAVAELAVAKLREVPGILGVSNETYVPPADEAMAQAMPHPVTARRPSVSSGPAVGISEPVASRPPAVAVAPPMKTTESLSPAMAVPVKRMTLADQIESLRLDDRRFQNVRIEVKNGIVVLRGSVAHSADAWEFAASVRQVPGVTDVVQSIETQR